MSVKTTLFPDYSRLLRAETTSKYAAALRGQPTDLPRPAQNPSDHAEQGGATHAPVNYTGASEPSDWSSSSYAQIIGGLRQADEETKSLDRRSPIPVTVKRHRLSGNTISDLKSKIKKHPPGVVLHSGDVALHQAPTEILEISDNKENLEILDENLE